MTILFLDYETRSPVDLKKEGLARYAADPRTEIMCGAYAFDDEPIEVWLPPQPCPERVKQHIAAGGTVIAHNIQFDRALNNAVAVKYGWPKLDLSQCRCTLAACYSMALPGALENAAHALGLKISKDTEGRSLMLKCCKPRADGTYYDTPEARKRLAQYCAVDVAVEREIYKRVMALPDREQKLWELDQIINLRGIPFDMDSLRAAVKVADVEKIRLNKEMAVVTQGAVAACSALPALKEWAADFGVMPDSLAKAELNDLLEDDIPEEVKAVLRVRQAAGRFTSISKLDAIERRQINGRVPYTFQYHAATTGRWAGRGIQPQNFTRDLPEPAVVEDILELLRVGSVDQIRDCHGEPSTMISKCLRGFIHAAPGKVLMGGDFANVEGRGIAWLAGDSRKLTAFQEYDIGIGPDIYLVSAERIWGRPFTEKDPERQHGKVAELACGFGGGKGGLLKMAKTYLVKIDEVLAEDIKTRWREAHPEIVKYWYDLENAAIRAVKSSGEIFSAGHKGREIKFRKRGSFLWCRLPSGRNLCYPYPTIIEAGRFGKPALTFKGVPDTLVWSTYTGQRERGEANTTYVVEDKDNTREWCRMATYSGKLAENITQAICRDLLAEAMTRVEAAGFPIAHHAHDEIVVEGYFKQEHLAKFQELMTVVPAWAAGFPIAASCWLNARYIKG